MSRTERVTGLPLGGRYTRGVDWLSAAYKLITAGPAGGRGSMKIALRMGRIAVALTLLTQPRVLLAQECAGEPEMCAQGELCPLKKLPFEEFIAAPPAERGRYGVPAVRERPFDPTSGDKVLVRRFVVAGVESNAGAGITPASVQAFTDAVYARLQKEADPVRLTVGQMVIVADEVTTFYRNNGYLVAKAFIPVQTITTDAVVRIQVIEGRVSEVQVDGAKRYSAHIVSRPAAPLMGETPIQDSVETALLYTQDYPGLRMFGTFQPGAEPGDTKLILQVLGEERFEYRLGGDNYGIEQTGVYRLRADVSWNNPAGLGDELDLSLLQAVAPENTTFGSLGYRVPFAWRGFGATVAASRNAFRALINNGGVTTEFEGTINAYEAGFDWSFKRSRLLNGRAALTYGIKESSLTGISNTLITDDSLNIATLTFSGDRIDTRFKGLDLGSIRFRQGFDSEFAGVTAGGLPTDFSIYDLRYTRLQQLGETQSLVLQLRAQESQDSLSSLEQFALSGPDAVRAYQVGDFLRDTGGLASLEYKVQAPGFADRPGPFNRRWGELLQFGLFADYAYGKDNDSPVREELSGYGLNIQFGVPRSFDILLQGAAPGGDPNAVSFDDQSVRVYGQFTVSF